jgi:hypothetical protein
MLVGAIPDLQFRFGNNDQRQQVPRPLARREKSDVIVLKGGLAPEE